MANQEGTFKDKFMQYTLPALTKFTEECLVLLKGLYDVLDTFNERNELVDFPCVAEYFFLAFGAYFLGLASKVLLLGVVLLLAHGERRAVRQQRRVALRLAVEEADSQTLTWLGKYLQDRAPLAQHMQIQDQSKFQTVGWLNELVQQAWPHAEPFYREHLEQLVTMLKQYMDGRQIMGLTLNQLLDLRIETFRLGTKAPIIKGVRVVRRQNPSQQHGPSQSTGTSQNGSQQQTGKFQTTVAPQGKTQQQQGPFQSQAAAKGASQLNFQDHGGSEDGFQDKKGFQAASQQASDEDGSSEDKSAPRAPDRDDHYVVEADIVYVSDAELVVCSQKLKAGIRELYVSGRIHVDLGPTITKMPLMAGLSLYMLEPPTIDFVTTSTASALDKLTREHISKLIRTLLTKVITELLVIPNNITVPFVDASSIRCPTPQGTVRVCVVEAHNVPLGDLLTKKDPYCVITLGAEQSVTQCVKKTVSPCWVHWAQFVCTGRPGVGGPDLQFTLMDHDAVRSDTIICKMRLGTREVREKKLVDKWLHCSKTECLLRVQALWLPFTDDETQLPVQLAEIAAIQSASLCRKERKEGFSSLSEALHPASATTRGSSTLFSCVLMLWLDSASGLPESSGNWRVQVEAGGDVQHSWAATQATDASWAWKQSFLFQLTNVHHSLNIKLRSHDGNLVKGRLSLPVEQLLHQSQLTTGNMWLSVTLSTGCEARIRIDRSLKILSPAGKAMEDLKVINRKVREAEVLNPSTAKEIFRIGRSVSKSILAPKQCLTDGGLSPESQSTFYPESSGSPLSSHSSDNSHSLASHPPPSHSPHLPRSRKISCTSPSLSPCLPRSRRSSNATSLPTSASSSSLLDVPKPSNPNISESDVKLRVRKKMLASDVHPSVHFANRRSISLENLSAEIVPEKEGNLISKSLKRIKNTKMSRIHARDIFSPTVSNSSKFSKSTLLIYGATTDPEQLSQLFKDAKTS